MSAYIDREQTEAKHFILKRYLQELTFKVLNQWEAIAYIDGFSGPWEAKMPDYSDTSFMIAIEVLKDAQKRIEELTGHRRTVKCYFSENDRAAFQQLQAAVAPHHQPSERFEVRTYCGDFEDAVADIQAFAGDAFPLVFIDPTGWTGYPFAKIKPLFARRCEVLINFMYDFVNRAASMSDPLTVASLDPILGGPGWVNRLDASLPRGRAVEKLFRETLKSEGQFAYVVSTKIDKSTADRPHFYLAYGTKSRAGLKAFRQTEYDALRKHAASRVAAKERKREERTGTADMFAGLTADTDAEAVDAIVREQMAEATAALKTLLAAGPKTFAIVVDVLLEAFMLRETNVKTICADLARTGTIENTWGSGNRRPSDETIIRLTPQQ